MPIKQINHITTLQQYCDGDNFIIAIATANPSRPQLLITCREVQNYLLEKDTQGTVVPHGLKKWVPQIAQQLQPTICQGNAAIWSGAYGCPVGAPCSWFIAELGATPPLIEWDSLLHPCACDNPANGIALGYHNAGSLAENGNFQQFSFLRQLPQTTLPYNGFECDLPSHGSFSVSAATAWSASNPLPPITMRIVVSNDPNSPYTAEPTASDARPCAGSVITVPRSRITGPGWKVTVQAMSPPHFGQFFSPKAPGLFLVDWYDD